MGRISPDGIVEELTLVYLEEIGDQRQGDRCRRRAGAETTNSPSTVHEPPSGCHAMRCTRCAAAPRAAVPERRCSRRHRCRPLLGRRSGAAVGCGWEPAPSAAGLVADPRLVRALQRTVHPRLPHRCGVLGDVAAVGCVHTAPARRDPRGGDPVAHPHTQAAGPVAPARVRSGGHRRARRHPCRILNAAVHSDRPSTPVAATERADVPRQAAARGPAIIHVADQRYLYTVERHDTLSKVAKEWLGDAGRWPEVCGLNKHRHFPVGGVLRDCDLIYPGWELRLPADARPPQAATPATPSTPRSGRPATPPPSPSAAPDPSDPAVPPPAPEQPADTPTTTRSAAPTGSVSSPAPPSEVSNPAAPPPVTHSPTAASRGPGCGSVGLRLAALVARRRHQRRRRNGLAPTPPSIQRRA